MAGCGSDPQLMMHGEDIESSSSLRNERIIQAAAAEEDMKLELRLGPSPVHDDVFIRDNNTHQFQNNYTPPRTTHKFSRSSPVVGWPPVRSLRKDIGRNSNKQPNLFPKEEDIDDDVELLNNNNNKEIKLNTNRPTASLFVKIYVEGFPIGRKLNLGAYHSYHNLSLAIHQLFGALLVSPPSGESVGDEANAAAVSLSAAAAHGQHTHTLVYEDHEGDRILVGDVPWNMFVTTAKKLHVLRTSPL